MRLRRCHSTTSTSFGVVDADGRYTPTPALSHAVLVHNTGRPLDDPGRADGIEGISFVLLALCWGSSFLWIKLGLTGFTAIQLVTLQNMLSAGMLWLIVRHFFIEFSLWK